jgi:hypothetical protein
MAYRRATVGGGAGVQVTTGTTGVAVPTNISNWGVTLINVTSADVFYMAPPVAGCQKTLVFGASSSTVATVVALSSAQTVSVYTSTGTQANPFTMIKKGAGASTISATVVNLVGLNSTQWLITGVHPGATTTPTPALHAGGSITLST